LLRCDGTVVNDLDHFSSASQSHSAAIKNILEGEDIRRNQDEHSSYEASRNAD